VSRQIAGLPLAPREETTPAGAGLGTATGEQTAGEPGPLARRRPGRHLARPLRRGTLAQPVDAPTLLRVLAGLHRLPDTPAGQA
jgi:hypothetical protein